MQYLRAASVLGRRFRTQIAADISGFTPRQTAEELQRLAVAGVLSDAGVGWAEFRHALVRDAIYELAAPGASSLHEAAFRATVARNLNPAEAAEHALTAELAGDPQAIEALTMAGRHALAAGAVETARRYLEAGADFAGDFAAADLLLDLGTALMACGENGTAIAVHESLLRRPNLPASMRLAAVRQLARATFHVGQIEQATAWLDQAVRDSTGRDRELTVTLLVEHAAQLFFTGGPRAGLPVAARARELATPDMPAAIAADHVWGFDAHLMGIPGGLAVAESAAAATERSLLRNPKGAQWWDARIAYAYLLQGSSRYPRMLHVYDAVLGRDSVRVDPMMIFQALFQWVEGLCLLGRLDEALTWSERMVEAAELLPFTRRWAAADKALVLLELGRIDDARTWCATLTEPCPDGPYIDLVGHLSCGRLALRQGDPRTACTHYARTEQLADTLGIRDPCFNPWAGDAITAYLACGELDHARRIIEWVERGARTSRAEWPRIIATTARAALAEQAGDNPTAQALYADALELHADLGMPIAHAQTLTDYGAFLTRTAEPARARPLLADALAAAHACGAAWHAAQAEIWWRRAGGRTGTTPAGQLTPQERAVVKLAAAGNTNREIAGQLHLSINTVQTHLRHTYQKLGIQRRTQLTDHPQLATHDTH